MSRQEGFTLIELMIVVMIIGILVSIAVPRFQYFVAKSQVVRVVGESGDLKAAVDTCILDGRLTVASSSTVLTTECDPAANGSNLQATGGNSAPTIAALPMGTGVPDVVLNADGSATIVATFGNNAAAELKTGGSIIWSRDTAGTWVCQSVGFDQSLASISCPI